MYHYHRLLICSLAFFTLLFTACKNPPDLSDKPTENIVKIRMGGDPENLNFLLTSDGKAIEIFKLLSIPFASFDPETHQLTPTLIKQLAIATEITEGEYNGTTAYDLELLEEATWDDGKPVTVEDVLFTLKAIYNPNYSSPHLGFTRRIKGFETDEQNPKKFRVYFAKYFLAKPVIQNFEAMPKHIYDPKGLLDNYTLAELMDSKNQEKLAADTTLRAFAKQFQSPYHLNNPAGISYAGPYKIEKWTTGQEIVLVKKKNWWGEKVVDKYLSLIHI